MIWWHNLTFQPFPLVVKQAPRRKVLLTGPAPRNSLSSLISTHGQAGGVHAVRDQPSSLKGRNNWYTADEAKKRRRHQILPQARLSKSEEELSVCKTWKEDISKESHLLWQYFGGGGCENHSVETLNLSKDWEDALANKPQQISVGNRLLVRSDWSHQRSQL